MPHVFVEIRNFSVTHWEKSSCCDTGQAILLLRPAGATVTAAAKPELFRLYRSPGPSHSGGSRYSFIHIIVTRYTADFVGKTLFTICSRARDQRDTKLVLTA